MKIGDIKLEAIKIMFVNYNADITIEQIGRLKADENYNSYLVNMPGSINRCLSNIEDKRVLPVKSYVIEPENIVASGSRARFDLSSIEDFFDVDRVVCETATGDYITDHKYSREGNILVIHDYDEEDSYRVLYYPSIKRISSLDDENTKELDVPENIAVLIPYFIKGDLYREDEPNEASEARNWYEAGMEAIYNGRENKITSVKSVYSQI